MSWGEAGPVHVGGQVTNAQRSSWGGVPPTSPPTFVGLSILTTWHLVLFRGGIVWERQKERPQSSQRMGKEQGAPEEGASRRRGRKRGRRSPCRRPQAEGMRHLTAASKKPSPPNLCLLTHVMGIRSTAPNKKMKKCFENNKVIILSVAL